MMNHSPVTTSVKIKTITIGAFAIQDNAHNLMQKIKDTYGYDLFLDMTDKGLFRLNIGKYQSTDEYRWILNELKKKKLNIT